MSPTETSLPSSGNSSTLAYSWPLRGDDEPSPESIFREAVQRAYDAMLIVRGDGKIEFANLRAGELLGYAPGELRGMTVENLIPQALRAQHLEHRARYAQAPRSRPMGSGFATSALRKDGTELPVDIALAPSGVSDHVNVVLRDLTAQQQEWARQRLFADVGLVLGQSLSVEGVFEEMARLAVREFADWCVVDLGDAPERLHRVVVVHRDPSSALAARLFQEEYQRLPLGHVGVLDCLRTGQTLRRIDVSSDLLDQGLVDEVSRPVAGQLGMKSYVIAPLQARGVTFGAISFIRARANFEPPEEAFVTELVRRVSLGADNARLLEAARRQARAREETVAVVSHDLKNPVSAIQLSADVALLHLARMKDLPPRPELQTIRRAVETILRAARMQGRLISDLLDFAKLESGRYELARERVALNTLFEEVDDGFRSLAKAKGVELVVGCPSPRANVLADRARLAQVLSNLLGNALKFTPAGGRVALSASEGKSELTVSVEDTGRGIAASELPHIFDRYFQGAAHQDGAGLGLAIARGIIEAHGGRIWATSTPGQGSAFFFALPRTDAKDGAATT